MMTIEDDIMLGEALVRDLTRINAKENETIIKCLNALLSHVKAMNIHIEKAQKQRVLEDTTRDAYKIVIKELITLLRD